MDVANKLYIRAPVDEAHLQKIFDKVLRKSCLRGVMVHGVVVNILTWHKSVAVGL